MNALTIRDVAHLLNSVAQTSGSVIQYIHAIRREITGKQITQKEIFSGSTIFDYYAFHDGGRSELQFNVAYERDGSFRYGVMFSFRESQSHGGDTMIKLLEKAPRFAEYLVANPLPDMELWYRALSGGGRVHVTARKLLDERLPDTDSVFLGKLLPPGRLGKSDMQEIIRTFDELLPLYVHTEGGSPEILAKYAGA